MKFGFFTVVLTTLTTLPSLSEADTLDDVCQPQEGLYSAACLRQTAYIKRLEGRRNLCGELGGQYDSDQGSCRLSQFFSPALQNRYSTSALGGGAMVGTSRNLEAPTVTFSQNGQTVDVMVDGRIARTFEGGELSGFSRGGDGAVGLDSASQMIVDGANLQQIGDNILILKGNTVVGEIAGASLPEGQMIEALHGVPRIELQRLNDEGVLGTSGGR